jgi:hypothetical protein
MGDPKTLIARLPWWLVHRGYLLQERIYRYLFGLSAVGELIYLGRARYRGPSKVLADRTCIDPGDPLGTLHFNNLRLMALERQPGSEWHRALVFRRLLRDSLVVLARRVHVDPELKDLAGFRGITWMPAHGQYFGFETEPLPSGLRARCLNLHFRLMLDAFYPEATTRPAGHLQPQVYWLTRRQLISRYVSKASSGSHGQASVH